MGILLLPQHSKDYYIRQSFTPSKQPLLAADCLSVIIFPWEAALYAIYYNGTKLYMYVCVHVYIGRV